MTAAVTAMVRSINISNGGVPKLPQQVGERLRRICVVIDDQYPLR